MPENTRMQQTAWRVIRYLPRRCRGDHTGLSDGSQSWLCGRAPQLIRMLSVAVARSRNTALGHEWGPLTRVQGAAA